MCVSVGIYQDIIFPTEPSVTPWEGRRHAAATHCNRSIQIETPPCAIDSVAMGRNGFYPGWSIPLSPREESETPERINPRSQYISDAPINSHHSSDSYRRSPRQRHVPLPPGPYGGHPGGTRSVESSWSGHERDGFHHGRGGTGQHVRKRVEGNDMGHPERGRGRHSGCSCGGAGGATGLGNGGAFSRRAPQVCQAVQLCS